MGFDADLEYIVKTAKSDSADAEACRQVLLSLWDDGEPDGCELLKVMSMEKRSFEGLTSVLRHLYEKHIQLDMFMSTKDIESIVPEGKESEGKNQKKADPYAHWL